MIRFLVDVIIISSWIDDLIIQNSTFANEL